MRIFKDTIILEVCLKYVSGGSLDLLVNTLLIVFEPLIDFFIRSASYSDFELKIHVERVLKMTLTHSA